MWFQGASWESMGSSRSRYGVSPDQQGKGYATEATEALVAYAFGGDQVRLVRAHTLCGGQMRPREC